MSKTTILAACGALMLGAVQAMGAVVVSHSGTTDPTTESPAWTLSADGTSTGGSGVTHLGEPAWKMTDLSNDATTAKYIYSGITAAAFTDPGGWTATWRMAGENLKLLNGDDEATMRISDGFLHMAFTLKANGTGAGDGATLTQRFGNTALKSDIPTIGSRATGFHTFALNYDGTPGGAGVYSLYYDNALVTSGTAGSGVVGGVAAGGAVTFGWGGYGGNNNELIDVNSYWNSVKLETIPEPSGLALFFAAALPMLRRKR